MARIPEAWRHTEWVITRNGRRVRYWKHCQSCFKVKGNTWRKLCLSCSRRKPKVIGLQLRCAHGEVMGRNDVIRALYMAGGSSPDIGKLFNLSANQILNIVKNKYDGEQPNFDDE